MHSHPGTGKVKNRHYERRLRQMRQYHKHHPWRLDGGLFIPHIYPRTRKLSWSDDVGFILNRRRVMVWWRHPRCVYRDAIEQSAFDRVPLPTTPRDFALPSKKIWRKMDRSRMKAVSEMRRDWPHDWTSYFDEVNRLEDELMETGIDLDVRPSMRIELLNWAVGVNLVAPVEVVTKDDIRSLAALARRLVKRETTIETEFPGYVYGRLQWLAESELRLSHYAQQLVQHRNFER